MAVAKSSKTKKFILAFQTLIISSVLQNVSAFCPPPLITSKQFTSQHRSFPCFHDKNRRNTHFRFRTSTIVGINEENESYSLDNDDEDDDRLPNTRRRKFLLSTFSSILLSSSSFTSAYAAPPMSVIAEELGYFPVTNRLGETIYVSARVKRNSSDQAVKLAQHLQTSGAIMYGAFWCPHCQRQKEIFGRQAWELINYVECDKKGAGSNTRQCVKEGINGFPTWKFKGGKEVSGEMPLVELARVSGYKNAFDGDIEPNLPASSGACR